MATMKNLKKFRKDNDMSQKELADILGITQVNYCRYEKGLRCPDIETLQTIIQRINVSGSFLLDCEEHKNAVYISENADFSIDCDISSLGLSKVQERQLAQKIILVIADYKRKIKKK